MSNAPAISLHTATRPADVARSLAFYAVFYFGSIFIVTAAVIAMALPQRLFLAAVRGWSAWHRWCCRIFLGIRVKVEGQPPRAGVLYAIKHESFFEAIDLPRQYPNPVVFAKAELMRIPLWGRAAQHFGLIPVEREAGARALRKMLTEARRLVADGRPLVIFPEGTRVAPGTRPPLQAGFAGTYKLLGLPVIPVAVNSSTLYHRRWKRRGTITYHYGEEIPAGLPRDAVEARVHAAINALDI